MDDLHNSSVIEHLTFIAESTGCIFYASSFPGAITNGREENSISVRPLKIGKRKGKSSLAKLILQTGGSLRYYPIKKNGKNVT